MKGVNLHVDTDALLKKFSDAASASYRKYGVHHLSKSSVEGFLECTEKFRLKNRYFAPGRALVLGGAVHEVQEKITQGVIDMVMADNRNDMSIEEYSNAYGEYLDEVIENTSIPSVIINSVMYKLDEILDSNKELLLPGSFTDFQSEVLTYTEVLAKSVEKDHFRQIMKYPVLRCELRTHFIPEGLDIPYDGYIDTMVADGPNIRFEDLKTTFSKNQFVWQSLHTLFQMWLYAKAMKQMGYINFSPEVGVTRAVIDTKPKSKNMPDKFEITVERKVVKDIMVYDQYFMTMLRSVENMIKTGVEICGSPKFGCKKCGFYPVCSKRYRNVWIDREEEDNGDE